MARQAQTTGYGSLVPAPEKLDSQRVVINLDAAQVLAENGDLRESMRWLRRAADAAEQDGSHRRAVEIARAAAQLAALNRTSATPSRSTAPTSALSVTLVGMIRQLKGLPEVPAEAERSKPPPARR